MLPPQWPEQAMTRAPTQTPALDWKCSRFGELTTLELYQALKLRQEVFVIEQECLYRDLDGLDKDALHIGAWRDDTLLGYLRCLPPGLDYRESALGRIVVSPEARGMQLGRALVKKGIDTNLATWPGAGIRIGAQAYLQAFYESLGFVRDSDEYDEDGIPHIKMVYRTA